MMDSQNYEQQIRDLIEVRNLIAAIKLYREMTGVGLAEAKEAVEAMARGENANAPQFVDSYHQGNNVLLDDRFRELLAKRNKIEAIKLYRETHHVGLKEAKEVIDQLDASMRREPSTMNLSSEPVIGDDPFANDITDSRRRSIIFAITLLIVLCGLALYVFVIHS